MAMKITTGKENYKILDTGSVIGFNDEALTFHVAGDLKIILIFKNDLEVEGQKMDYNAISNNELEIFLTNFNNSLGAGNLKPIPVAKIDNKQVYFNFIIYTLTKDSSKLIHYTWYEREETQNG